MSTTTLLESNADMTQLSQRAGFATDYAAEAGARAAQ